MKKYFFAVIHRSPIQDQSEFDNLELMLSKMKVQNPLTSTAAEQLSGGKMILKIAKGKFFSPLRLIMVSIS